MTDPRMPQGFHTGLVVHDLADAMASYSSAFGLSWAPPIPASGLVRTPKGMLSRTSWITYSLDGPLRLELVEQIDDSAWRAAQQRGPRVHHLGFWVDDLSAEVDRLESLGFRCEVRGEGQDGNPEGMSYHEDPNGGLFIELVGRGMSSQLMPYLEGHGVASFADQLANLGLNGNTIAEAFRQRKTVVPRPSR